ncbi:MAG: penicillin acylase family protein [Candidatus Marinimicrobia bacterium]|nr:penicillin acylase family protein [Candidatus Neomarinimicrobiota bacterium]
MKLWAKIGLGLVIIVFIILSFGWIYLDYNLPVYEGELSITGLKQPVEIYFDDYAVPHIFAENEHDLFFTGGYISARERLFQMTVSAAASEGRLAELFGESALEDDIYLRTWGIPKVARLMVDKMSQDAKVIVESFCEGINACIDELGGQLPIEFKLLGIKPIRWEPKHVTGFVRMMGHNLTFSWKPEIVLGQVAYMFGEEKLKELLPYYPEDQPLIVPPDKTILSSLWQVMSERDTHLREIIQMEGIHLGSNSWVVSGDHTVTGKPILSNDPHLPFSQPAKWYEMHLVGGRFNVSGMCLTGIPVPVLGHNEVCAWGFTNLMVDDLDFYIETINPDNSNQYLYDGQYLNMDIREEVIRVKGEEDTTVIIRETVHGPIISDIHSLLRNGEHVISMRWGGHDVSDEVGSILKLSLMKNWDDFNDAAHGYGVPSQNVIYADTMGNIGWRPFGQVPIRKGGELMVPVPGESSEWDWQGYIPFDEMPTQYNPPSGVIITANNKVVDDSYPYYISGFWEDPSRSKRIWELVAGKNGMEVADMKVAQFDVLSPFAREISKYFVMALENEDLSSNQNYERALKVLKVWDGNHTVESAAAAIFNTSLLRLFENIYADEMNLIGKDFYRGWIRLGSMPLKNLRLILKNGYSSWCDNVNTDEVEETIHDLLVLSFKQGVQDLEDRLGPEFTNWHWGKLHTLTHPHTIGKAKPLLNMLFGFNVGPFPTGGAATTVNNGEYALFAPFDQINGPSFRRIMDLSDLNHTQSVIPTGQSGLPKSPHYRDQVDLYNSGRYRTVPFNPATIKNSNYRLLTLNPTLK